MGDVIRKQLRQPKIGDFGLEILVKKHVARLYVTMNYARLSILMEEREPLSRSQTYCSPLWPIQPDSFAVRAWNTMTSHMILYRPIHVEQCWTRGKGGSSPPNPTHFYFFPNKNHQIFYISCLHHQAELHKNQANQISKFKIYKI